MMTATNSTVGERRELVITQVLDAPREVVFKAWIDPKQMAKWWGPKGFTNPVCEMDVRPGGSLRIVMRGPGRVDHPMTGVFCVIVEPERLVFTAVARDKQDNPLLESLTTVAFAKHGGKTKLTVQASAVGLAPVAPRMLEGMEAGWTQSLERLANHVSRIG
jgi:uncharacterized protein YndB with AHSA1/START domain